MALASPTRFRPDEASIWQNKADRDYTWPKTKILAPAIVLWMKREEMVHYKKPSEEKSMQEVC